MSSKKSKSKSSSSPTIVNKLIEKSKNKIKSKKRSENFFRSLLSLSNRSPLSKLSFRSSNESLSKELKSNKKTLERSKRIIIKPPKKRSEDIFKQISDLTSTKDYKQTIDPDQSIRSSKKSIGFNKKDKSKDETKIEEQKKREKILRSKNATESNKSRGVKKLKKKKSKQADIHKFIKKVKDPKFFSKDDLKKELQTCRICFSTKCTKKTGEMIRPCNCRGIFSTVHEGCISEWIISMSSSTCDICRFKFVIKSKQKGLIDFIIEDNQFNFIWRLIAIIFFSLYLVLIVSAFILVIERYMDKYYIFAYKSSCSLIIFILLTYVGYYFVERYVFFKKWKKFKFHILVQSNPDNKFNEIITPPVDPIRSSGLGEYTIRPIIKSVHSSFD